MAQPTRYSRSYSFTGYQAANPSDPLPAQRVDAEFDAVALTTDETRANLALIQRDDGKLRNASVHPDAFDGASLLLMGSKTWVPRGAWTTSTIYAIGDMVENGDGTFVSTVAHLSGDFAMDRAAGKWVTVRESQDTVRVAFAPVTVATTENITLSGLQTVDGVLLSPGDRVLVKDQTLAVDNGIFVASAGGWSRASDFDSADEIVTGATVRVVSGLAHGGWTFALLTPSPVEIGSSEIEWDGAHPAAQRYFETAADMLIAPVGSGFGTVASVRGYHAPNDGGGGVFDWVEGDTSVADGGTVLESLYPDAPTGRWVRRMPSRITPQQFGARADGETIDTDAIQYAVTVAEAARDAGKTVTLHFPPAVGYAVDESIVIPHGINVIMDAPIIAMGSDDYTALEIGTTDVANFKAKMRLAAVRDELSSWASEDCIGIKIINPNACDVFIAETRRFTLGAQIIGSDQGASYNNFRLGYIVDNHIGLDLTNELGGWCNQNTYIGGRFGVFTGVNANVARIGVRITSKDGTYLDNNANEFFGASFELNAINATEPATAFVFEHAVRTHAHGIRCENTDNVYLEYNASRENEVHVAYNDANSVGAASTSTVAGTFAIDSRRRYHLAANKLICDVSDLRGSINRFNNTPSYYVQRLGWITSSGTLFRNGGSVSLADDGVTFISNGYALGTMIDTSKVKSFLLAPSILGSGTCRTVVAAYDESDALLTAASTVKSQSGNGFTVGWGSSIWISSADSAALALITVSSDCKRIFLGLRRGAADFTLTAFRVYALDVLPHNGMPRVWPGYSERYIPGPLATAAPDGDTHEAGEYLMNATPAAGGPPGWVCTTGGTPGTWKAMANLAS